MSPKELKERIEKQLPGSTVKVQDLTGTRDHYQVAVTAETFENLTKIQQHRAVMDLFEKELRSGEIHALTIKTSLRTK